MPKIYKYLWAWNEELVVCGGQGAGSARYSAKLLKKRGLKFRFKVARSSYQGHTLILFFCDDEETKNEIQKELVNTSYVDNMEDTLAWTTDQASIIEALSY